MNNILDYVMQNPILIVIVVLLMFILFVIFGALIGNVTAKKILVRFGFSVFGGNPIKDFKVLHSINKDGVGWLDIPDTCYAPIMKENKGKYRKHNFLNKESYTGEIYLSEGKNSFGLKAIAKKDTGYIFSDLSMIVGSAMIRSPEDTKTSQFTYLQKYINTDLKTKHPDIVLIDNGEKRLFNLLFVVEMGLENKKDIKLSSREGFIESMRELATYDTKRDADNDIIILRASTNLDTTLVFLVEK